MKLVISEKQLKTLMSQMNVNQDLAEQGEGEGAPEAGTSSDGEKKTGASKWESGASRGPANQIGVTKWADSYKISRGKANPLWEQAAPPTQSSRLSLQNLSRPTAGSDYFASVSAQNKRRAEMMTNGIPITKHVYRSDDGRNFFVNLMYGNIPDAILDLREFLFKDEVIALEIAVSLIFSETIVVPVAVGVLNGIVLVNDLYIWDYNGRPQDDESFTRVLEDLLILGSGGVMAVAGKIGKVGLKKWLANRENLKLLVKIRSNIGSMIATIKKSISGVKLPSGVRNWINSQISKLDELPKILDNLINKYGAAPTYVSKITLGVIGGLVGYVGIKALNRLLGLNPNSNEINTNGEELFANFRLTKEQKEYAISSMEDLNRYRNSGDLRAVAKKIAEINKNGRPCLLDLFNKGKFTVQLTSNKGDIYVINGRQHYTDRTGIYDVETNKEFNC